MDKFQKKHKLVIIPLSLEFTGFEENVILYNLITGNFGYKYNQKYTSGYLGGESCLPHHAHLLSDERPVKGDFVYIGYFTEKKVIATTKTNLNLPIIDPEFIQGILDDLSEENLSMNVMVYYEKITEAEIIKLVNWGNWRGENGTKNQRLEMSKVESIKESGVMCVSEDGFISLTKVKEIFTRQEVFELMGKFAAECYCEDGTLQGKGPAETVQWFNENI